ncbi:Na+/H+ antiporter NhaA [Bosea thiooxidans]
MAAAPARTCAAALCRLPDHPDLRLRQCRRPPSPASGSRRSARRCRSASCWGCSLGKQIGVFGFGWLAIRAGLADLPANASWAEFYGIALLCGIGFTMSLFIGLLAFPYSEALQSQTKIGVLAGSLLSGFCGWVLLRLAPREDMHRPQG